MSKRKYGIGLSSIALSTLLIPSVYAQEMESDFLIRQEYEALNNVDDHVISPLLYGWIQDESGNWYYYDYHGFMCTGWRLINDTWYYFYDNGHMACDEMLTFNNGDSYIIDEYGSMLTGWIHKKEGWYYAQNNGILVKNNWINDYYLGNTGLMLTSQWIGDYYVDKTGKYNPNKHVWDWETSEKGIRYVNGKTGEYASDGWRIIYDEWYFFDRNGYVVTDIQTIYGKNYYFDETGKMLTGWINTSKGWYYANGDGLILTGWHNLGERYYFDPNNGLMVSDKKLEIEGNTYFFSRSGGMETGWVYRPEGWYYANTNGVMHEGWLLDGSWYYLDANNKKHPGLMSCAKKMSVDSHEYIFSWNGIMETGFISFGNETYYANTSSGILQTGWIETNGKCYYFFDDYTMNRNTTLVIDGNTYHFNEDGSLKTGWVKENGNWYYLNHKGHKISGWYEEYGYWYYMDPETKIMEHTGFKVINNKTYFFPESGKMQTNWLKQAEGWYFFASDGAMRKGTISWKDDAYYMYQHNDSNGGKEGVMAEDCVIKNFKTTLYVGESGAIYKSVVDGVNYYAQRDPRWAYDIVGGYYFGDTGCLPTAATAVINYYLDTNWIPSEIGQLLHDAGHMNTVDFIGSEGASWHYLANYFGLNYENNLTSAGAVRSQLLQGKLVGCAVDPGYFVPEGFTHALLLFGYEDGYTYVYDSLNQSKNGWYPVEYIFNQQSTDPYDRTDNGPFYAI